MSVIDRSWQFANMGFRNRARQQMQAEMRARIEETVARVIAARPKWERENAALLQRRASGSAAMPDKE